MRTEVKLDGNYYKTIRPPTQTLANQMASKVGQGTSQYGDLTNWGAWIQENWQNGVGNLNPAMSSGILYSEAETRVPNQIILRGKINQVDTRIKNSTVSDCRYNPDSMGGYWTAGSAITTTKAAIEFTTPASFAGLHATFWAHVYLRSAAGVGVLFEVRNNNAGSPGVTVLTSATVTNGQQFPDFHWHGAQLSYSALSTATTYWLCVSTASGSFDVGYGTTGYNVDSKLLISGTWTAQAGKYLIYLSTIFQLPAVTAAVVGCGFFRFNGVLYCYGGTKIYKYSVANNNWTSVGTYGGLNNVVGKDATTVYFGNDAPLIASAWTMTNAEVIANTGVGATIYADSGAYIWSVMGGTTLSYSNGLETISTPQMVVGDYDRYVTGICEMGDSMFVSTNEGLWRIAPGDFAVRVMRWGGANALNGRSMCEVGGSLYVVADNRVYRLSPDLQRQDIWLSREDDLITERLGQVQCVCACNSTVLALVGDRGASSVPTVWAFQDEHWHCMAVLPEAAEQGTIDSFSTYAMFYDYPTNQVWLMTPQGVTYKFYVSGTAINPYNDSAMVYTHSSWIEWDWFDGPVREAPKDYDSVAIVGENISSTRHVQVYWKDDDSTDWELLGDVTSNYQELRWTLTSGTRPNTRRLKLGLRMYTIDSTTTPRIRSIRVKYHLMVRDWFRWNLVLDVSGRTGGLQEVEDGTRTTLTNSQIKAALDALVTKVPPFVYQDVDGQQWEVKVTDGSFTYTLYEYNENTSTEYWEGQYNIVLEQTTQGTYV